MQIGQATVRPVFEIGELALPPQMFVTDITDDDIERHIDWLAPRFFNAETRKCLLSQHAWLVEANGKRILVDPCVGHRRHRPALAFYHMIDSPLIANLEAMGVTTDSIDYVFCTHLHLDHVGWNTRLVDGRYVPTFPNARYIFSRTENDYWRRDLTGDLPEEAFNAGVYGECIQPVIAAGLADMVDEGARIADCITLIEAAGHTIGHMAGILESGGEGAVLAGDAIHHPLQVAYLERRIHDHDEDLGRATRHKLLTLCAERDFWLAPAHFRAPHMCKVRKDQDGYRLDWSDAALRLSAGL
jgi:glyoxylase-like metal-dependent hydrolase (beta-lactamase superfamily II)